MPYHLAIIRFSHEGNSFNPIITNMEAFHKCEYFIGEEARQAYDGTGSEPGGAIEFLKTHQNWQATFLRCATAPPGGPVSDAVIEDITQEVIDGLKVRHWDGIYVSLHGAMLGESEACADFHFLRAIRACAPDACIAATFDLHANMMPEIASLIDIGVGYKTYPHVDMAETAIKALNILDKAVRGEINPQIEIAKVGAVLLSHNMRTDKGPMADIEALARDMETIEELFDVTPFGGFSFGDSPAAGASVMICGEDPSPELARQLANEMLIRQDDFIPNLISPSDGIRQALSCAETGKPVAVLEPADNPMSGGIGDTPELLASLLEESPEKPSVFAFFYDPALAQQAYEAGIGASMNVTFGGKISTLYGSGIQVRVRIGKLTDGTFTNDGPMWQGLKVELGPTAVLQIENTQISVIVTSSCVSPNDTAYFRLHDIDLNSISLLCCKAKNHFMAAFGNTFKTIIDVDTVGPATGDLSSLPFKYVSEKI
ncbi:MAG: M81 family metallopeptidase [Rhodospirillales bacterium]|jgi:microcystin degradation protein MlrC|nr:M81 family metallopeptidase [Rhodospirillales bacterium]